MTLYNFQGDIANISERQQRFINDVIVEMGYKNSRIYFEPVGIPGDNYVANVKRIKIAGAIGSFQIIAKIAPTLDTVRQAMNTTMMFKNEHIMYTEVLPKFVQLQKDANIPETEQLRHPKCYGSLSEQPNEVILLEDLKVTDFKIVDRIEPLSNNCIRSVLRSFAILHSLSFVLRHKDQKTYSDLKKNLADDWSAMAEMEYIKTYFQALEADTLAILEDQKHIDFLRNKVTHTIKLAMNLAKTDINNKYTVIQHGDSSTNNIMFKFEGLRLVDSIMIDYQNSRCTSPACDILYLIFNCTDHETRTKNFYEWTEFYYLELEKSLSNFKLKAHLIYPRERLDSDLKQYSSLLFGLSVFLASLLIRKSDDAEKMKDAMSNESLGEQAQEHLISTLDDDSKMLFKKRVVGLIDSCIELNIMS